MKNSLTDSSTANVKTGSTLTLGKKTLQLNRGAVLQLLRHLPKLKSLHLKRLPVLTHPAPYLSLPAAKSAFRMWQLQRSLHQKPGQQKKSKQWRRCRKVNSLPPVCKFLLSQ
jgi:hypothetical protein